jgi:hypothetical protein
MTGAVSDRFAGERRPSRAALHLQHSPYNKLQKNLSIPRTRKEMCQTRSYSDLQQALHEANSGLLPSKSDLRQHFITKSGVPHPLLRLTSLTGAVRNVRRLRYLEGLKSLVPASSCHHGTSRPLAIRPESPASQTITPS